MIKLSGAATCRQQPTNRPAVETTRQLRPNLVSTRLITLILHLMAVTPVHFRGEMLSTVARDNRNAEED
jgi:hypothetical protein